jgi:hypothetical protein
MSNFTDEQLAAILTQPDYAVLDESPAGVNIGSADSELEAVGRQVTIHDGKRGNKFNAVRTEIDGRIFDSKAESRRYLQLRQLEDDGRISQLKLQPRFPLVVNGQKIADYVADFSFVDENGKATVEDVKSGPTKTASYRLKRKLVKALYGIEIVEVE